MGACLEDVVVEGKERLGKDQEYILGSDKIREEMEWEEKVTLKRDNRHDKMGTYKTLK